MLAWPSNLVRLERKKGRKEAASIRIETSQELNSERLQKGQNPVQSSSIMVEAQEQAKQLDSVTDHVREKEVDASKALQAMSSLSIGGGEGKGGPAAPSSTSSAAPARSKASASADSGKAAAKGGEGGETTGSSQQLVPAAGPAVLDPKDVQLIVDELEVTHEAAERALRKAIAEGAGGGDAPADPPVVAALRILVTSI
jgi:HYPK UBA domain